MFSAANTIMGRLRHLTAIFPAFILAGGGLIVMSPLLLPAAPRQSQAVQLSFEVASIKPVAAKAIVRGGCHGIDTTATIGPADIPIPLGHCMITGGRLAQV